MNPRTVRGYLEAALDELGWVWCRTISLLLDELVLCEERDEAAR